MDAANNRFSGDNYRNVRTTCDGTFWERATGLLFRAKIEIKPIVPI